MLAGIPFMFEVTGRVSVYNKHRTLEKLFKGEIGPLLLTEELLLFFFKIDTIAAFLYIALESVPLRG